MNDCVAQVPGIDFGSGLIGFEDVPFRGRRGGLPSARWADAVEQTIEGSGE